MDITLVWKGESFMLKALDRSTFLQVAMTFLSKHPKGLTTGSLKSLRFMHKGKEVDMNATLSAFNFANDHRLNVIEVAQESTGDLATFYDRVSYTSPTYTAPPGNRMEIVLADLITGQMYAQSALDNSQIRLVIDNLENALNTTKEVSLFNENGLINPYSTLQSIGLHDGDVIAVVYHSIKGTERLQLQDVILPSLPNKSRFMDAIRNRPCSQLDDVRFIYNIQTPEQVPGILRGLVDHPVAGITVTDSLECLQILIDSQSAVRNRAITNIRNIVIPWLFAGTFIKQMTISEFLLILPRFSFAQLSTLTFRCPSMTDAENREIRKTLQEFRYPLFVVINDSPLVSLANYEEQIANAKKTAEKQTQKVEEQMEKIHRLVDETYKLKKDVNDAEAKVLEASEAEAKRKRECETLIEQLRQMNNKVNKTESLRDEVLRMTVSASSIFDEVIQACNTISSDAQRIEGQCAQMFPDVGRAVRNISGASVFATQKLSTLRYLTDSCKETALHFNEDPSTKRVRKSRFDQPA